MSPLSFRLCACRRASDTIYSLFSFWAPNALPTSPRRFVARPTFALFPSLLSPFLLTLLVAYLSLFAPDSMYKYPSPGLAERQPCPPPHTHTLSLFASACFSTLAQSVDNLLNQYAVFVTPLRDSCVSFALAASSPLQNTSLLATTSTTFTNELVTSTDPSSLVTATSQTYSIARSRIFRERGFGFILPLSFRYRTHTWTNRLRYITTRVVSRDSY